VVGKGHVDQIDRSLTPVYAFDESVVAGEASRWGAWGFDRQGGPLECEIAVVE
jgi:hypothetical protein